MGMVAVAMGIIFDCLLISVSVTGIVILGNKQRRIGCPAALMLQEEEVGNPL